MVQSKHKQPQVKKEPSKTKFATEKTGTPVLKKVKSKMTPSEHARMVASQRAGEKGKLEQSTALIGRMSSGAEKQKDLYLWLQSIPLSQPLVKIERDFSDGTLVAEVIHYYCPHLCDKRNYFKWYSSINKVSNWRLLNYKVFPKLGFQINERQIHSLMHPFSCGKFEANCDRAFIHKLLHKIRDTLAELNPAVDNYKKKNFTPPKSKPMKAQPMFRKRPKVNGPTYSKVEMMIEQGYYDKKPEDKDKEGETPSEELTAKAIPPTEGPSPQQAICQDMQKVPQACEYEYGSSLSPCSKLQRQRRYTTVEDETTIYVRPSYCVLPPKQCSMDEDPCYNCFYW